MCLGENLKSNYIKYFSLLNFVQIPWVFLGSFIKFNFFIEKHKGTLLRRKITNSSVKSRCEQKWLAVKLGTQFSWLRKSISSQTKLICCLCAPHFHIKSTKQNVFFKVTGYFKGLTRVIFGYLILFRMPILCIIKWDMQLIINDELKMVIEYLKWSHCSSGETQTANGIANLPDEVQAILVRWSLHSWIIHLWFI
jgi:hypothetical protein